MRYLILFLFIYLASISVNAQKELNLGEVRYDSAFNCKEQRYSRASDKNFNLPDICDSKNDLEIRLKTYVLPNGQTDLIILSNKDGKWDAKKYIRSSGTLGPTLTTVSYIFPEWNNLFAEQVFTNYIDTLIKCRLFLLPDKSELKHEPCCLDGVVYILTFKAGTSFRTYSYDNPHSYLTQHPDSKEYAYIQEIAKLLNTLF